MSNDEDKYKDYKIFDNELDFISKMSGFGSFSRAQTDNIRGINANLNGASAPANMDSFGMTFFTRPDLNLSYNNIIRDRMLWLQQT